jgi:signal transduction histidine kinase
VTLSATVSLTLFRTAQEALRNVVRHAGVDEAWLSLHENARNVELVVEDRGRGFSKAETREAAGIGLIGIEERARLAGGEASIESRPGGGTTVAVRIPLARTQR